MVRQVLIVLLLLTNQFAGLPAPIPFCFAIYFCHSLSINIRKIHPHLQYRSKVTYHRLARRVSNETRRVSRETIRVSFLASALEVPKLRIYRYSKPVFLLFTTYSDRIYYRGTVDTSFHCRQRCMCTMSVLLKFSTVHQYCFIHVYIGQTFF